MPANTQLDKVRAALWALQATSNLIEKSTEDMQDVLKSSLQQHSAEFEISSQGKNLKDAGTSSGVTAADLKRFLDLTLWHASPDEDLQVEPRSQHVSFDFTNGHGTVLSPGSNFCLFSSSKIAIAS